MSQQSDRDSFLKRIKASGREIEHCLVWLAGSDKKNFTAVVPAAFLGPSVVVSGPHSGLTWWPVT